jgi:hypothetical protein
LGLWPRSGRRPNPQNKTRSQIACAPSARRFAWQTRGRAARPCAGELPVRRRRPLISLGCEQMGRLRVPLLDGKPGQTPARGGGADGATRGARRRDTAAPRLRRPSGGAASLGPRAGVRSTLGFRLPKPAARKITTARRPDSRNPQAARNATSRAGASGVSTARSWPRRAGVRPARTHALIHSSVKKNHGSTAG